MTTNNFKKNYSNNNFNGFNNNNNNNILPNSKRQRTSYNDQTQPNQDQEKKIVPSRVVHARNLAESVQESDLLQSLQRYGKISFIVLMPKKRQALIEFVEITSSITCVNDASRSIISIAGSSAYLNYASCQKIERSGDDECEKNHVLLFEIINPLYPIKVEVIHTICSPFGKVLRIAIFRKNGIQTMVEFDSVASATKAKESLNGAEIYSGCCGLKVEYAKPNRINVQKNDDDSWDFTAEPNTANKSNNKTPNEKSKNGTWNNSVPDQYDKKSFNKNFTLKNEEFNNKSFNNRPNHESNGFNHSHNNNNNNNNGNNSHSKPSSKEIPSLMRSSPIYPDSNFSSMNTHNNNANNNNNNYNPNQILLLIYNLCPRVFNCDRLFNLLSLYGNVDRIKFLLTKEGSAMAQMSNPEHLNGVLNSLNATYIFGKKIQINISNQNVLIPVAKPADLPDGTPSFKEYFKNRNNRYQTAEAAQKNKPVPPSNILHWFNAPPGMDVEGINEIFSNSGAKIPAKIKIFQRKSDKCTTGLAEWNTISDCIEALVLANHVDIDHPSSKFPYTFKLCFSSTPIVDYN